MAVNITQTLQKTWASLFSPSFLLPERDGKHYRVDVKHPLRHDLHSPTVGLPHASGQNLLLVPTGPHPFHEVTQHKLTEGFPFQPDAYILPFETQETPLCTMSACLTPPSNSLKKHLLPHPSTVEPSIMTMSNDAVVTFTSESTAIVNSLPHYPTPASDYDTLAAKLEALEEALTSDVSSQELPASPEAAPIHEPHAMNHSSSFQVTIEPETLSPFAQNLSSHEEEDGLSSSVIPSPEATYDASSALHTPHTPQADTIQEPLFISVSSMSSSYSESNTAMNYAAPANAYNDVTIAAQGQTVYPTRSNYGHEVTPQPTATEPDISSNVQTLLRLIGDLPEGVSKQVGAQIIRSTMEAMGIAMDEVLSEAQNAQTGLLDRVRSNLRKIDEYNTFIRKLQDESKYFQSKAAELGEVIDLFVMSSPSNTSWMNQQDDV
jgi:hypothetical protein